MSYLVIELCPETGICSIVKSDGRADLTPAEVDSIRDAEGDVQKVEQVISQIDKDFAAGLDHSELRQIAQKVALAP
jgi:hypothetical protein